MLRQCVSTEKRLNEKNWLLIYAWLFLTWPSDVSNKCLIIIVPHSKQPQLSLHLYNHIQAHMVTTVQMDTLVRPVPYVWLMGFKDSKGLEISALFFRKHKGCVAFRGFLRKSVSCFCMTKIYLCVCSFKMFSVVWQLKLFPGCFFCGLKVLFQLSIIVRGVQLFPNQSFTCSIMMYHHHWPCSFNGCTAQLLMD